MRAWLTVVGECRDDVPVGLLKEARDEAVAALMRAGCKISHGEVEVTFQDGHDEITRKAALVFSE